MFSSKKKWEIHLDTTKMISYILLFLWLCFLPVNTMYDVQHAQLFHSKFSSKDVVCACNLVFYLRRAWLLKLSTSMKVWLQGSLDGGIWAMLKHDFRGAVQLNFTLEYFQAYFIPLFHGYFEAPPSFSHEEAFLCIYWPCALPILFSL